MKFEAPSQFLENTAVKAAADTISKVLRQHGFQVLYAGGWVRDLLMGARGDDIDIATDATPEQILTLFPKAIEVGAAFGVLRVIVQGIQFEIATFRTESNYLDGRHPEIVSSTLSAEEDASRRDFTINGIFYDPFSNVLLDYVGGIDDIHNKIIRTIGKPIDRFTEDRLRIIRAIRFKNTLSFDLDEATWNAVCALADDTVSKLSSERIWQEVSKMHTKKVLAQCLEDLYNASLLPKIFPHIHKIEKEELFRSIDAIKSLSFPSNTTLAVSLLFPYFYRRERISLVEQFHLSNEDMKAISTISQIEEIFHEQIEQISERQLVAVLSLPYAVESLDHLAAISKEYSEKANFLKQRFYELFFWIEQLILHRYHITGQNFLDRGFKKGKKIGMLIEKAFALSLSLKEKDKSIIISKVLEEEEKL